MLEKLFGFLTLKGWEGVKDIYWFVAVGAILGFGIVYFLLIYRKDPKPYKFELTHAQSLALKIAIAVALLILLLII